MGRNNELYSWRNTIKCYLIFSRRDLQHDAVPLYEGWPAFVLGVQGVPLAEYHWGLYRTAGLSGEHLIGKLSGNSTVYTILTILELKILTITWLHSRSIVFQRETNYPRTSFSNSTFLNGSWQRKVLILLINTRVYLFLTINSVTWKQNQFNNSFFCFILTYVILEPISLKRIVTFCDCSKSLISNSCRLTCYHVFGGDAFTLLRQTDGYRSHYKAPHYVGATAAFAGGVVYGWIQTRLSWLLEHKQRKTSRIQLVLMIWTTVALLTCILLVGHS